VGALRLSSAAVASWELKRRNVRGLVGGITDMLVVGVAFNGFRLKSAAVKCPRAEEDEETR